MKGLLALGIAAALTAGGCSDDATTRGNASQGGSVVVAEAAPPNSLDPALASSPTALRTAWLAYTPAVTYRRAEGEAGTELVAALAEELPESDDEGRTYTFTVRRGIRYSDGRLLRASDFERGLARTLRLNPTAAKALDDVVGAQAYAARKTRSTDIAGIEADDRAGTVQIELETPDRLFPYVLASTWAAPVPRGTPLEDLTRNPPPGIGPYAVVQVRRSGDVVLNRRYDWELPAVPAGNPQQIVTRTIPDLEERVRTVQDGRADLVEGESPVRMLPAIRSEPDGRYEEHRTLRVLYLSLDASRPPFRDPDVRRALSYALDSRDLARIRGGFLQPTCNLLPPEVAGYRRLDPCPYGDRSGDADLVEASRLVEQADAVGAPVGVAAAEDARGRAEVRWLVETLRKIGLTARVVAPPVARVAFEARRPAFPHPAGYLHGVDDPVLHARVRLLEQESAPQDAASQWAEVDEEIVTRAYLAPYGLETAGVLASKRLDMVNCSRFHPVMGMDYSSVCVR